MKDERLTSMRKRVAREAAVLLYTSQEKEYKQAKTQAAKTLGVRVLPSNFEIADELDELADAKEGVSRRGLLVQMRQESLQLMEVLNDSNPKLVGSVWRGTAHRNSDIDIIAFSEDPQLVLNKLRNNQIEIIRSEWRSVTKKGEKRASFHIHLILPSEHSAEIVVRRQENSGLLERCEIYGDISVGLKLSQLLRVLAEDPYQTFLPKRRVPQL